MSTARADGGRGSRLLDHPVVSGTIAVGPHGDAHWVALRAGVSVGVPLAVLEILGLEHWMIYAVLGSFVALYGRLSGYATRARMQGGAAAVLIGGVLVGAALSAVAAPPLVSVAAVGLWAAGAAALSDVLRWHPPGALFPVFAIGASAAVPTTATELPGIAAAVVASALFSLLVGAAGRVRPARLRKASEVSALRGGRPGFRWRPVVGSGIAVAVAGGLATVLGVGHPYWAMVSAVVPIAAQGTAVSISKGVQRIVGTGVGLLLAACMLSFDLGGLVLVGVAVVLQVLAELTVGRNYGIAMAFVTPLALCMVQFAHPADPSALIRDRALETALGIAVGLATALMLRGKRESEPAVVR